MTIPVPPKTKVKGSPQLLVLLIIVIVPAFGLGAVAGAGPAALIGAFVALFALMTAAGGPLRRDLLTIAALAPALAVAAVVPRLLSEVSTPAAIIVIIVIVVAAALLPLAGPRFNTAALGLGMLALMAYSIPLSGAVQAWQLVVAAGAGLVVAVLLRLLMGIGDPTAATRKAVAAVFDDDPPALTPALDNWLADGRPRWLGETLTAASRYRVSLRSVESLARNASGPAGEAIEDALTGIRDRATELAEAVRAKPPRSPAPAPEQTDRPEQTEQENGSAPTERDSRLPADAAQLLSSATEALDSAARALQERDSTATPVPHDTSRRLRVELATVTGQFRSVQLRHAVRTGVGVLLALLLSLRLPQGDPLMTTLLLTTFGILQISWRDTITKARPRILGLVVGVLISAAVVYWAPPAAMMPIALVALVIALWNLQARPVVGYAALMCMSVGLNSSLRHLDPGATLAEYAILTAASLLIGVVIGFAIIPGIRLRPLPERIERAVMTTTRSIQDTLNAGSADPAGRVTQERLALQRDAVLARRDLVPDHDKLTDDQAHRLEALRVGLQDLAALSTVAAFDSQTDRGSVIAALQRLETTGELEDEMHVTATSPTQTQGGVVDGALMALAAQVNETRQALTSSLAQRY